MGSSCYPASLLLSPGPRPSPVFRSAVCDCLSLNVSISLPGARGGGPAAPLRLAVRPHHLPRADRHRAGPPPPSRTTRTPMGDETCPVSTERGTRRVQLVREGGGRGGHISPPPCTARCYPPPSLPYKVNTSRPSLRTNWTSLVPFPRAARGSARTLYSPDEHLPTAPHAEHTPGVLSGRTKWTCAAY